MRSAIMESRIGNEESRFVKTLNFIKKPADTLDDIWNAIRKLIPEAFGKLVAPFIIGSVFFVIHLLEAYNSGKEFYEAYLNEQIAQRKTRLFTSFLSCLFAGAGFGLSISLILGALAEMGVISAAITGIAFFPIIIPGLLASIYSLSLWKLSYILHRAKEDEVDAKAAYETLIENPACDPVRADQLYAAYQQAYNHMLQAEREVALKTIEVTGSILCTLGVLLGTAAAVGAGSVATFGALPLALLVTGVVIGLVSKCIEYKDGKENFKYTQKMRHFFRKLFGLADDHPECAKKHMPKMDKTPKEVDKIPEKLEPLPASDHPGVTKLKLKITQESKKINTSGHRNGFWHVCNKLEVTEVTKVSIDLAADAKDESFSVIKVEPLMTRRMCSR